MHTEKSPPPPTAGKNTVTTDTTVQTRREGRFSACDHRHQAPNGDSSSLRPTVTRSVVVTVSSCEKPRFSAALDSSVGSDGILLRAGAGGGFFLCVFSAGRWTRSVVSHPCGVPAPPGRTPQHAMVVAGRPIGCV